MTQMLAEAPTSPSGGSTIRSTAVVSIDGASDEVVRLIETACRLAKLDITPWQPAEDGSWPAVEAPVIAVGVLRSGERRVPVSLVQATRLFPGLPVVLVASEPLVKEVLIFNRHQLSLVDPSITADKLATHLVRIIQTASRSPDVAFVDHYTRVVRPSFGWAAAVSRFPGAREVNEATLVFPWFQLSPDGTQLRALLPEWEFVSEVTPADCARAVGPWVSVPEAGLGEPLSLQGRPVPAVVAEERQVLLCCPPERGCVWLLSPQRLPHRWRVTGDGGEAVRVYDTTPGDLYVLHSDPLWTPPDGIDTDAAGLLRRIRTAAREPTPPFAVVLIEIW